MNNKKKQGWIFLIIALVLFLSSVALNINHQKNSLFMCELVEQSEEISMQDCPAHNSNYIYFIATIMAVSFGLMFFSIYLLVGRDVLKPKTIKDLGEEENKILDFVNLKKGSAYQSEIVKNSGYSKVKVTRILDKLEGKGLIERKRRGMTNIVILK